MANQSTLRQRSTTTTRAAAASNNANKENLTDQASGRTRAKSTSARSTSASAATTSTSAAAHRGSSDPHDLFEDEEENDSDGGAAFPSHNPSDAEEEEDDDDGGSPVHRRVRRVSEKQKLLDAEQEEADERCKARAEKQAKAARKAAGFIEVDKRGPIQDDTFTSRTVTTTRPAATKQLAQRDSRVPPPTKSLPTTNRVSDPPARASHQESHSARHRQGEDVPRVTFRGRDPSPPPPRPVLRSPCNPDHVMPDHVTLHLRGNRDSSLPPSRRTPSRSASPEVGEKRRRSSSYDPDDIRSTQAVKTTAGSRPRAKDLDDVSKEYTAHAIDQLRCLVSTENFFPTHSETGEFVRRSWEKTCEELGEELPLSTTVHKLIAGRVAHTRGEAKTKVKAMTEVYYGFRTGHNKKTIAYNRKLAEDLKEECRFAYKDVANKKGLFKHPIIQKAVNAMWFANRRDEGPSHPEYFKPIPVEALAAILTVVRTVSLLIFQILILSQIENTIDEYLTGIKTDVPFTTTEYRTLYDTHLHSLLDFDKHTAKYNLLDKILTRLHDEGRFHSGAQPIADAPTSSLSKSVLDAALKEYEEEGSDNEDDDEMEATAEKR
ncbi:hypothetical protein R3P38DRAFT_3332501 [Favolaschia claudopus]|uniref:DUF6532 domain-containing protein n=1 Tax=Favolaschia claudopus TaxID=2862362 RepID=A0AAV9ZNQ2_9AGAR